MDSAAERTGTAERALIGQIQPPEIRLFFFFSNRLGCLGSILISVVGTLVILALLGWL